MWQVWWTVPVLHLLCALDGVKGRARLSEIPVDKRRE